MRIPLLVTLLLVSAAPLAGAAHWTLHYGVLDHDAGWTREDDEEVFHAPGSMLDGRVNQVVAPGAVVGADTLFLDARLGNEVGFFDLYAGALAGDLVGRTDVLLPGTHHGSAWYGWWNDVDHDGFIDDFHDRAAAPLDEFKWRGAATTEAITLVYWLAPGATFGLHGLSGQGSLTSRQMNDRTAINRDVQEWVGSSLPAELSVDGGVLATYRMLTVAGAPAALHHPLGYDIDAPGVLIDVDRYESLSPDVEPLWRSSLALAWEIRGAIVDAARDEVDAALEVAAPMIAVVFDATEEAREEILAIERDAWDSRRLTTPFDPKEPNTPWDDYEGRAFYGGFGDIVGTGNTYSAYAQGYRFWFDALPRLAACGRAWAPVPTGGEVDGGMCVLSGEDPVAARGEKTRGTGSMLLIYAFAMLWRDLNGDGHVGSICNPQNPDQWDGEAGACREQHLTPGVPYHPSSTAERRPVCDVSSVKGGTTLLRPLGGSWDGAILMRDYVDGTRGLLDQSWELLEGDAAVELRFPDSCGGNKWTITTRDAIFFPAGTSNVPLRIETHAGIAGYVDFEAGISVGTESVVDVDVLRATL